MSFPTNMRFNDVSDQIALDNKVKTFSEMLYDPSNYSLAVSYPSEESLLVFLPAERKNNIVLINESYDKQWKAYFKGQEQSITPVGPNFMSIHLTNTTEGGKLILYHTWPLYYYVLLFMIIAAPMVLLVLPVFSSLSFKRRPKINQNV